MTPTQQTRRDFLKAMGAGAVALAVPGCRPVAEEQTLDQPNEEQPVAQIGLQLWTLRKEIEQDLAGTLQRVAEMGYAGVETAFFPEEVTLEQAGKLLRDLDLPVFAAHAEIPVGKHRDAMLAMAEAYDCDRMVWHGWPEDERYQTMDGIKRLAEIYNEALVFAQSNGLHFGLHNHWWEFQEIEEGGYPFYLIKEMLEPDIFFEIDTYWAKVAGLDPAQVVGDFGGRAPLLHIKDASVLSTEGPMVAVGQGVQDFPAVVQAAHGATAWMIVELDDCETDMFEAVAQSYRYLTENGLAQGKS